MYRFSNGLVLVQYATPVSRYNRAPTEIPGQSNREFGQGFAPGLIQGRLPEETYSESSSEKIQGACKTSRQTGREGKNCGKSGQACTSSQEKAGGKSRPQSRGCEKQGRGESCSQNPGRGGQKSAFKNCKNTRQVDAKSARKGGEDRKGACAGQAGAASQSRSCCGDGQKARRPSHGSCPLTRSAPCRKNNAHSRATGAKARPKKFSPCSLTNAPTRTDGAYPCA